MFVHTKKNFFSEYIIHRFKRNRTSFVLILNIAVDSLGFRKNLFLIQERAACSFFKYLNLEYDEYMIYKVRK